MERSGIYCFRNKINNKMYIGKSTNLKKRFISHMSSLKNNKHNSFHFQSSYNKYGENSFEYSILEYCDIDKLDNLENYYINLYNTNNRNFGYNILKSKELSIIQSENAKIRNLKFHNLDKARKVAIKNRKKEIYQFLINGTFVKQWNSIKECSDYYNIDRSSIVKCCKGKIRYFKGYVFSYLNEFKLEDDKHKTKIKVIDKKTNIELIYNSITDFCNIYNISDTSIIHASIKKRNGNYKNFKIIKL